MACFQPLALLHDALAFFGLIPEIGVGDLFFELVQLRLLAGRVKDSSAQRLPAAGA